MGEVKYFRDPKMEAIQRHTDTFLQEWCIDKTYLKVGMRDSRKAFFNDGPIGARENEIESVAKPATG